MNSPTEQDESCYNFVYLRPWFSRFQLYPVRIFPAMIKNSALFKQTTFIFLLICTAAAVWGFERTAESLKDFQPSKAGLGQNTTSLTGKFQDRIVADLTQFAKLEESFSAFRSEGKKLVLWLGASQLHAVNRCGKDDLLAVVHANYSARDRGAPLAYIQVSEGNANFYDLLGSYLIFRQKELIPDWIVIAVTYDDLRERTMKETILKHLPPVSPNLLRLGGEGIYNLRKYKKTFLERQNNKKGPIERSAVHGTPQQKLERFLTASLEKIWPAYRYRGRAEASIEWWVQFLFSRLVVVLFERPSVYVPAEAKDTNMKALRSLIRIAKADGTSVLLYKAPHRPGEKIFYHNRQSYDSFFNQLKKWCKKEGVPYADFERLVPTQYWGLNNGGRPDVFHFQGEGHKRLGAAVDTFLASQRKGAPNAL